MRLCEHSHLRSSVSQRVADSAADSSADVRSTSGRQVFRAQVNSLRREQLVAQSSQKKNVFSRANRQSAEKWSPRFSGGIFRFTAYGSGVSQIRPGALGISWVGGQRSTSQRRAGSACVIRHTQPHVPHSTAPVTRRGVGVSSGARGSTGAKGSRRRERGRFGEGNDASRLEGGLPEVRARTTIFPPFVFGHRRAFPPAAQTSERGARRVFRSAHGPGGCFTLWSTTQTRIAGIFPPDNPSMRAFPPSPRREAMASFFYGRSRRFTRNAPPLVVRGAARDGFGLIVAETLTARLVRVPARRDSARYSQLARRGGLQTVGSVARPLV